MTREDLVNMHKDLCKAARALMEQKNADYAHGEDPFANFRMFGERNARVGIVLRLGDKLRRLMAYAERGDLKASESVTDTVLDIINYAVLFAGLVEDGK